MVSPQVPSSTGKLELSLGIVVAVMLGVLVWGITTGWHVTQHAPAGTLSASATGVSADTPSLIPLGRRAAIGSGWNMTVVAVLRNVSQRALGIRQGLASGRQNIAVEFTFSYVGAGRGNSRDVVDRMKATVGGGNAVYAARADCLGPSAIHVTSGHAATGMACFVVSSHDAQDLKLFVTRGGAAQATSSRIWFALR